MAAIATTSEKPIGNSNPWQRGRTENAPHAWWILALILAAAAMNVLDGTIVNVAIPSIRADLGTNAAAMQWIVGGYALTFAIGLIAGGRLGDIYGRKRMYMVGVSVFTLTSLACGLAPTTDALIVTRLLQGFGASLMVPQGFGLVRENFSQADLPKALSFWGPSVSIAALMGPVVGGLLIELDAFGTGWRAVFLVNVPIGIALVSLGYKLMPAPRPRDPEAPGLDLAGAAILGVAIALLFFPLIQGRDLGWPFWIFALLPAGLGVLYYFARFERNRGPTGKPTLIVSSIFGNVSYVAGALLVGLIFCCLGGLLLTSTLYLQLDQGFTAIHTGLTMVGLSAGMAIGALAAGIVLLPRIGRHTLHLGALLALAGLGAMIVALSADGDEITSWNLAIPFLVLGTGVGMLVTPSFSFAMSPVKHREIGSASGVLSSMQQLGTAVGVAVIGTIFFSFEADHGMLAAYERSLGVVGALVVAVGLLILMLPMQREQTDD